jgi:hypothetical protein
MSGTAAPQALASAQRWHRWFGRGWLALGYVFLYVPIVALVLYSFNDSPIPNVWRGFTLKWYTALANDGEMLAGLWLSLKIALSHRLRLRGAGHAGGLCTGQVQALHWPHPVLGHGQRTAGDARGGGRPVAAADAGQRAAGHRLSRSAA